MIKKYKLLRDRFNKYVDKNIYIKCYKKLLRETHDLNQFSSVQFSRSVVSESLRPHEPQHTRPPCPSPTPGVNPTPCPLSQ